MTSTVKSIPNGYHTATPYLTVQEADKLIAFMQQVFEAKETERVTRPDGKIAHANVRMATQSHAG